MTFKTVLTLWAVRRAQLWTRRTHQPPRGSPSVGALPNPLPTACSATAAAMAADTLLTFVKDGKSAPSSSSASVTSDASVSAATRNDSSGMCVACARTLPYPIAGNT